MFKKTALFLGEGIPYHEQDEMKMKKCKIKNILWCSIIRIFQFFLSNGCRREKGKPKMASTKLSSFNWTQFSCLLVFFSTSWWSQKSGNWLRDRDDWSVNSNAIISRFCALIADFQLGQFQFQLIFFGWRRFLIYSTSVF